MGRGAGSRGQTERERGGSGEGKGGRCAQPLCPFPRASVRCEIQSTLTRPLLLSCCFPGPCKEAADEGADAVADVTVKRDTEMPDASVREEAAGEAAGKRKSQPRTDKATGEVEDRAGRRHKAAGANTEEGGEAKSRSRVPQAGKGGRRDRSAFESDAAKVREGTCHPRISSPGLLFPLPIRSPPYPPPTTLFFPPVPSLPILHVPPLRLPSITPLSLL